MYNESQKFINFNATTTKRKKKKKSIKFKDRVIMFVIYKEDKPRILESGQDEESREVPRKRRQRGRSIGNRVRYIESYKRRL